MHGHGLRSAYTSAISIFNNVRLFRIHLLLTVLRPSQLFLELREAADPRPVPTDGRTLDKTINIRTVTDLSDSSKQRDCIRALAVEQHQRLQSPAKETPPPYDKQDGSSSHWPASPRDR